MPANNLSFLDPYNQLLAAGPARLDGGTISAPDQPTQGVLTVRTASTTLTSLMSADDLDNWAKFITNLATQVRGGSVALQAASPQDVATVHQAMQRQKR
jgi:hypothetical protein